MKIIHAILFLFSFSLLFAQQDGNLDLSFNRPVHDNYSKQTNGFNEQVVDIFKLNNGNIFVYGNFTKYYGKDAYRLAIIDENGRLDDSFQTNSDYSFASFLGSFPILGNQYIIEQEDGKILVGNYINHVTNSKHGIYRINPNGTFDDEFTSNLNDNIEKVYHVNLQPDQKILIGGGYFNSSDIELFGIIRLNPNGSKDATFNLSGVINQETIFFDTEILENGKILVSGEKIYLSNSQIKNIIRLNSDGSIDTSFNYSGTPENHLINQVTYNSNDNKIYILEANKLKRLNPDGSLFDILFEFEDSSENFKKLNEFKILPNGNISIIGNFVIPMENNISLKHFVIINTQGEILPDFYFKSANYTTMSMSEKANNAIAVIDNDKILIGLGDPIVGEEYKEVVGEEIYPEIYKVNQLVMVNQKGTVEFSFNPFQGILNTSINKALQLNNGNILLQNYFNPYVGTSSGNIYNSNYVQSLFEVNQSGKLDSQHYLNYLSNRNSAEFILQETFDNKILLGGSLIYRMHQDGLMDDSFNSFYDLVHPLNVSTKAVVEQNDGKYIVAGNFNLLTDIYARERIVRLNNDGSIDTSFVTGKGFNGSSTSGNDSYVVNTLGLQQDGKILAGGDFTNYNLNIANNIVRLNVDGTIDNSFNTGSGFDQTVHKIIYQNDGKIMVVGRFTNYNDVSYKSIIRLLENGEVDYTFNSIFNELEESSFTSEIERQIDGKYLITGLINQSPYLYRLNTDGSLDETFKNDMEFTSMSEYTNEILISDICILNNNKILLTGKFKDIDGITRNGVALLGNDSILNNIEIQENDKSKIKIYPNPFTDELSFHTNKQVKTAIVYDLTGKLIQSFSIKENKLNLNHLPKGIYFLQIKLDTEHTETAKIIKN